MQLQNGDCLNAEHGTSRAAMLQIYRKNLGCLPITVFLKPDEARKLAADLCRRATEIEEFAANVAANVDAILDEVHGRTPKDAC